jgi:Fic family protein
LTFPTITLNWREDRALRPEDFTSDAPGQLVRTPQGYWTFEPSPLPPVLAYDAALARLLAEAERALGALAGIGQMLPNPHLLIQPFIRREAVLSSRIEGTVTRLEQLLLFEIQPDEATAPPDVQEVVNYVTALEFGLARLREMPLSLRLLREVHARLMADVRGADRRPGEFRTLQVVIGRTTVVEEARFVPPGPLALPALLRDFERFLNEPGDLPMVVQLALAHYQFEAIHPFMDGNGRLGRLLITMMLCERRCLPQPLLYLSAYLERHRDLYLDHLLEVSRRGAWRSWVEFFARGIIEQAGDAAHRARRLLDLAADFRRRLVGLQSTGAIHLIDQLFESPFMTTARAKAALGCSFNAAQRAIAKLEQAGIVRETTGRARNRVYLASEILALLDAPESRPEPTPPEAT